MVRAHKTGHCVAASAACVVLACCSSQGAGEPRAEPNTLKLSFSPMYSAYDGVREYQLPVTLEPAAYDPNSTDPVDVTTVRWKVDTKYASQQIYPELPAGVLLTTKSAGTTVVTAEATSKSGRRLQGTAVLNITKADPAEWERYNNNVPLMFATAEEEQAAAVGGEWYPWPKDASCANCHNGVNQMLGVDVTIEHTPQQTAGYSDDELIKIFTMGAKPAGGKFHSPLFEGQPLIFVERSYKQMHTWDIAPEAERGIVYKLRSITPQTQEQVDYDRILKEIEESEERWREMMASGDWNGDGVRDDNDSDGYPDDTDLDGIPDYAEDGDWNGDGMSDDADGDGWPDDSDLDGIPDYEDDE
jgi:hypothetical protein